MSAELLDRLNDQQRQAVVHTEGPLLVLAGAGSGKTRVIAYRVVYLLAEKRIGPKEIVAVTFTNKAAREMRERIGSLVGSLVDEISIRTFHSLCLGILRREAPAIGFPRTFLIYDERDRLALVRDCIQTLKVEDMCGTPREVVSRISSAKSEAVDPQEYARVNLSPSGIAVGRLYEEYERRLRAAHAMDFDDLLLKTLALFHEHPETGERYAKRIRYLLVDEYQDTNRPQRLLVKALSKHWGNVCVVGDEDQAIYGFRGADVGNILRFEKDFPDSRIIKLERNYRSTRKILKAASEVVNRNRDRIGKTLWTEGEEGEDLERFLAPTDREEAVWVAGRIRVLQANSVDGDNAILYRTNFQSRPFEEALTRDGIAYRMIGGIRFYERKEIKDLMAYLRVLVDPADDIGLERILNVPPRGLGRVSLEELRGIRDSERIPLHEAIRIAIDERRLSPRALQALESFNIRLEELRRYCRNERPGEFLRMVLERIGYPEFLQSSCPRGEAQERMENLDELISAAAEFEGFEDGLQMFLDRTSLIGETDQLTGSGQVTLMTIHSAKGLEFSNVFLVGLEEGLFPHQRSLDSDEGMEEERRLFYVGLTRARKRVFLTHARARRFRGTPESRRPSPFLDEIPQDLVRDLSPRWETLPPPRSRPDRVQTFHDPDEVGYSLGQQVHHPTLGVGTVIGIEGAGENLKLTISFPGMRAKKIMARYTNMEPVTSA